MCCATAMQLSSHGPAYNKPASCSLDTYHSFHSNGRSVFLLGFKFNMHALITNPDINGQFDL